MEAKVREMTTAHVYGINGVKDGGVGKQIQIRCRPSRFERGKMKRILERYRLVTEDAGWVSNHGKFAQVHAFNCSYR